MRLRIVPENELYIHCNIPSRQNTRGGKENIHTPFTSQ
jgi:hypothetical protein